MSAKTTDNTPSHGNDADTGPTNPVSPYLVHEVHTLAHIVYQRLSAAYAPTANFPVPHGIGGSGDPTFGARAMIAPWVPQVPTFYWYP